MLRFAYIVAVRRTVSSFHLEMVQFLGIVLAVALMSSGVIFSDLLAEAALGHTLGRATPEEANFQVRTYIGSEAPATVPGRVSAYQADREFVDQRVGAPFRSYLRDRSRLLETPTFFFKGRPQLELDDDLRPRGDIEYLQGLWPERAEMVQGRWPYSGMGDRQSFVEGELEVAVDMLGAQLLQLGVGDEMEIFPAAAFTDPSLMRAKIVGVFQRTHPEDEFWYAAAGDFSFKNDRWTIVPLFTTEGAILRQMVGQYPSLFLDITWFFYLDRQEVRAKDVDTIQSIVQSVKQDVRASLNNGSIAIKLDQALDDYEDQLLPARIPMFLIIFLVTGILIFFLGLVSGLIVKSRHTELAMFKSRGATTPQLGLLALVESLILAAPAVALGPLLAQAVVRLLERIFFELGGGGELAGVPVALSSQAFLLGLAGGVLAVASLTGFTLIAARQGIVEFRQAGARPPRAPFIHRYYLDILLLVLIGVLWWQTQSRESFLVRSLASGHLEIDYSLLLGPVLGLLAIGLLVLRLFPIAVALSARISEPVGPSWLVHGLRHVSRDPIVPGVLVIMVMLATTLGIIGSTFSSTLERSHRDRALYAAGADFMIQHSGGGTSAPLLELAGLVGEVEIVKAAAEVQRTGATLLTRGFSAANVAILGVDTDNFDRVAWYRPDFAGGKPLTELTSLLKRESAAQWPEREGITLPRDASSLALWVQPSRPDQRLSISARLKDVRGRSFDVHLGRLEFRGWQQIKGELVPRSTSGRTSGQGEQPPLVTPPYRLISLNLTNTFGSLEPGALFLAQLSAATPAGNVVLDDFQSLERWHVLEDHSRPDISYYALESSELATPVGAGKSAAFTWDSGGIGLRGIRIGQPEKPVPAVVSRSILDDAQARLGDTLNVSLSTYTLPLEVVAVADYFPTLDPGQRAFAVVDLRTFTDAANLYSPRPVGGSNEIWIDLKDQANDVASVTAVLADNGLRFREARIASELVSQSVDQPLVNAGWGALLVLVFLALVLASASGVMLFSYIDTRQRQTEFALLRTLGSSTKQLNGVVWFSIILVVACGIGLGTWVGFQTSASLLPLMEVAEEGVRVVPPMALKTDWTTLLASYLVLAAVTSGTVAWLAWFSNKIEVQRALRIGEG